MDCVSTVPINKSLCNYYVKVKYTVLHTIRYNSKFDDMCKLKAIAREMLGRIWPPSEE